jgi:3-oxoacyl-[acyl-carrier protein] reductase
VDPKNKTIVVTGGARGLGLCMAEMFAAKGANLALVDINKEDLEKAVKTVKAHGVKVEAYAVNVAVESEVEQLFDQVQADFGSVDCLINNAGIIRDGLLVKGKEGVVEKKMSLAQWQSVIDVNLTGVFLCGREAAVKMIENKNGGVIINISSVSKDGNLGQSNYTSAKAAVAAMAVTWAKELAKHQIRAAAIAPGFMNTEILQDMKQEALEKISKTIPLKRLGEPEEIAKTALFIFENDYLSGRTIYVDGGFRL